MTQQFLQQNIQLVMQIDNMVLTESYAVCIACLFRWRVSDSSSCSVHL